MFAVVLASGSLHATVLGLGTACDLAGTREVGDTEVESDREVRGQIAWRETEVCVAKRAATVSLDSPRVRAPGHDEEASAVFVRLVKATNAPHVSSARRCKLGVGEHVTINGEGAHVRVPSNEIDVVLQHVGVEPTQEGSGCITFLGNFVVDMD